MDTAVMAPTLPGSLFLGRQSSRPALARRAESLRSIGGPVMTGGLGNFPARTSVLSLDLVTLLASKVQSPTDGCLNADRSVVAPLEVRMR